MPLQAPQWTDFLSCPICNSNYDGNIHQPISLGCGHTVCKACLLKLQCLQCPYDQTQISREIEELPVNSALLQLVGASPPANEKIPLTGQDLQLYKTARRLIEQIALYLQPTGAIQLSRPMQRKLVTLINCQMIESDGRGRTMRSIRSLAERSATELILQHQNPQQLSANLWAAVRSRGCQFLGPAMQEEVLKLILLALEDGSALSRKVLVLFVVQRLEPHFPQASKTSIGHVVQLLYRASCFKVAKRDGDSSLMQLKDEFRTYEALRREHDAQIVQIATEAGLRIAPDQWSSLLYGDTIHKSHMQSIIDKLQTPQSFTQSIQELVIALQRTGDPHNLSHLRQPLELLANIDPSTDAPATDWRAIETSLQALKVILDGLVQFIQQNATHKLTESTHLMHAGKYKTSMCRDLQQVGGCPRGLNCTFAHSQDELEKNRSRSRKNNPSMKSSNAVSDKLPGGFNRQSADVKPPESVLSEKADVFKPKLSDVQPTPLPAVQPVPMIRALVPTPDHPEALLFPTPPVRGFLPMEGMVQQQQQQQQGQQGAPAVAGLHPGVAAAHALPGARHQPFYGGSPAPYQAVYGGDLQRSMYQAQPESMSYPMMESYTLKEVPAGHMMQHSHTAIPDSFQNAVAFQSEQIAHQQIKIAALHQRKKEILLELDQCQSQMVAQTTLPTPSSAVNSVSCASTHPQYTVSRAEDPVINSTAATVQVMTTASGRQYVKTMPGATPLPLQPLTAIDVARPRYNDEIIPFKDTPVVSRFGPISRNRPTHHCDQRNIHTIQTDALQGRDAVVSVASMQNLPRPAVTAVPPGSLYYESIPSVESAYYQQPAYYMDQANMPYRLSTIFMKVPVVTQTVSVPQPMPTMIEPETRPMQDRVYTITDQALSAAPPSIAEKEHLKIEMKKQDTSSSEKTAGELAQELQAIEFGIQRAHNEIIEEREKMYTLWQA